MKKYGKFFSLALAALLALSSLTACGNSDPGKFMLGGIGPLTGDVAIYGLAVKNGAQIAVDEINAAGGIAGVEIDFNMQDDIHDPEIAVNAYNSLKDWGMHLLMGTVTSGPCTAVVPLSSADNIFQITASASSLAVLDGNDNVFQVCFTDPNQGIGSAEYIGQVGVVANDGMMVSNVAIIYDSSDVYSTGIYEKFVQESANQPFNIVTTETFTADSSTDFSVQLQKARDAGAQLVFLPIYYQQATLILTQAAALDFNPVFFGCDGLDGILAVENFDTSLAEGVILLTPFAADADDGKTKAFVAEYQKRHGEVPNQFAANAYDTIYIIKTALESGDAATSMSASEIGDLMKAAMVRISYDGVTGLMTWNAHGEVRKAPKAMMIINGAYVGL